MSKGYEWARIALCFALTGLAVLGACSDDPEPTEDDPPFSNVTNNNQTNNATNNMTIGTACETNEDCTPPEPRCRENVVIRITGNGVCLSDEKLCNYFPVTEEQDCAITGQSCEAGECVDNACTGVVCEQPVDFCEGNTLVFYTDPGTCNLDTGMCEDEEFRVDCAAEGGECMDRTCIGQCVGVVCDTPPDDFCDPMTGERVTHDMGMCDMMSGECSYPEVRAACPDMEICVDGACVEDPCLTEMCLPPADTCMNNSVVSYSGNGMCIEATGMCDYSAVEMTTDCGTDTCINAQCVNTTPAAGELVIVEIMHDPEVVADTAGEWFEIINVTMRPLDLEGLEIASGGMDLGYTISTGQPLLLQPGDRFTMGINDDMMTNGEVPIDMAYTDIVLDASDSLTLTAASTQIDTVSWDDMTWPNTPGSSMTFGDQNDPAVDDNADVG